jgi:hypothetical protein
MKTIEKKRYYQPVINIIKMKPLTIMAGTTTDTGPGGVPVNTRRGFFFEEEEE